MEVNPIENRKGECKQAIDFKLGSVNHHFKCQKYICICN